MTAPKPTARERQLRSALDVCGHPLDRLLLISEYRDELLREFEALAKEWSAQIDWSMKHTPDSQAVHGVCACRNKLEDVIARLRGDAHG